MGGQFARRARAAASGVIADDIRAAVRDVPNFPKPGIVFKDITPVLANPRLFRGAVSLMARAIARYQPDEIVAIESRGFLLGAPVADALGLPLQLVRKPGKLPYKTAGYDYQLEYGSDRLEIHIDAIARGQRVAIVDDLLATGGTAAATAKLVEQQGGEVACCAFLIELAFLDGRHSLARWPVERVVEF
ncbi:MAG: adenine phosphoribosyltransferase [Deltaproteobacteria bacterium]|nr:MAG: adenine phosphoribosyltransferase [Deltaproteobacteria bacterium]